jgi:hypothetical protein
VARAERDRLARVDGDRDDLEAPGELDRRRLAQVGIVVCEQQARQAMAADGGGSCSAPIRHVHRVSAGARGRQARWRPVRADRSAA